jgi:hypothetical protein
MWQLLEAVCCKLESCRFESQCYLLTTATLEITAILFYVQWAFFHKSHCILRRHYWSSYCDTFMDALYLLVWQQLGSPVRTSLPVSRRFLRLHQWQGAARSAVMSAQSFCYSHSMVAILGWPLQHTLVMSVLPSVKRSLIITHCCHPYKLWHGSKMSAKEPIHILLVNSYIIYSHFIAVSWLLVGLYECYFRLQKTDGVFGSCCVKKIYMNQCCPLINLVWPL